jgi:hypothetical protein
LVFTATLPARRRGRSGGAGAGDAPVGLGRIGLTGGRGE